MFGPGFSENRETFHLKISELNLCWVEISRTDLIPDELDPGTGIQILILLAIPMSHVMHVIRVVMEEAETVEIPVDTDKTEPAEGHVKMAHRETVPHKMVETAKEVKVTEVTKVHLIVQADKALREDLLPLHLHLIMGVRVHHLDRMHQEDRLHRLHPEIV